MRKISFLFFLGFSLFLFMANGRYSDASKFSYISYGGNDLPPDTLPNSIFTEDVLVRDTTGATINLRNLLTTKDTVMIFVWCKHCGSCISRLDWFNTSLKQSKYQIIAITINGAEGMRDEMEMIKKRNWPFQFFFDQDQNVAKFFHRKAYYHSPASRSSIGFYAFPNVFMFVKGDLLCNGCDKYSNPFFR